MTGTPKAQVSARKRSGKQNGRPLKASLWRAHGGLWRAVDRSVTHRRGAAALGAPDLSGPRTEGRQVHAGSDVCAGRLFVLGVPRTAVTEETFGTDAHRSSTFTASSAPASSTSAAGTCRCSTARRSTSTTPCAAPPACSTSRTCASSISRGRQVRAFLQHLLANDVAQAHEPGKALYSCMLNEAGGVIDDLIVYFLDRVAGSAWSSTPARATRTSLDPPARAGLRRRGHRAHGSRDARRAGPEARAKIVAKLLSPRSAHAALALEPFFGARDRRLVRRAHRLHRRGRLRDHDARGAMPCASGAS